MKITYILKKGFQYFPPCLSQVLCLNDLGVDIEVYHGKNSEFIDSLFDQRNIKHFTFEKDRQSKNKVDQVFNFLTFSREIKRIQKEIPDDNILWIGNLETAMTMDKRSLSNRKFILNVLELYNEGTIYDRYLKKMAAKADILICCEKHRAAIMQSRYSLKQTPVVMPNKPYELNREVILPQKLEETMKKLNGKFLIVYQGIIMPDRPLADIGKALRKINDSKFAFVVMGRCDDHNYIKKLESIYDQTYYLGYIPAPQHLAVTSLCHVGVANYDFSDLNNVFCAPNKIYEYAKFGKPMLASKNIGLTETVGAYGAANCVDFTNIDDLAEAIMNIVNNYETYSAAAVDFYNGVDYRHLIEDTLKLL